MVGYIAKHPSNRVIRPEMVWRNTSTIVDLVAIRGKVIILPPGFTNNVKLLNGIDAVCANKQKPYYEHIKTLRLEVAEDCEVKKNDVFYSSGRHYRLFDIKNNDLKFVVKDECVALRFYYKRRRFYLVSKKKLLNKNSLMWACVFAPRTVYLLDTCPSVDNSSDELKKLFGFMVPSVEEHKCLSKMLSLPQTY